jgi:phosphocarrier protein
VGSTEVFSCARNYLIATSPASQTSNFVTGNLKPLHIHPEITVFKKKLPITNKLGLHARAASLFVKTASAFASTINVSNPEKEANGKSIMSMMLLQASCGSEVDICIEGKDEIEAMAAIESLINDKFGESE